MVYVVSPHAVIYSIDFIYSMNFLSSEVLEVLSTITKTLYVVLTFVV